MSAIRTSVLAGCLAFVGLLVSLSAQSQGTQDYAIDPVLFQALEWRNIGPFRGGRVPAVAGHPEQQFTYYMGATGGGGRADRRRHGVGYG